MNLLNLLDPSTIWESIKAPLRQILLALYALLLNKLFVYITTTIGFEFTEDQKVQLLSYGTPLVWAVIAFIDKTLHQLGKKTGSLRLTYGLTPYLEKINNA